ncbi:hypothetical protein CJI97_003822 [Candidozyma auris]|uniref:RNA-dependent ATPase ROK1 n=1 Tax=Candidozyma auris TaxID=498019 RepID=UPI000C3AB471|nr:RNA-dependent ATPase ROK1 [[Candida] auris]PIS54124.1 hypothetical protein CJI97_003822 [[Candida] auris]QEO21436.1 hypothetical_protein [[Candida] auris]GBL48061.1 putative DEXH box helicase [[Candida] auris]
MDIFRILSRGAALKTSKSATADFSGNSHKEKTEKDPSSIQADVDRETDFFRTKTHKKKPEETNQPEKKTEAEEPPKAVITNSEEAAKFRKSAGSKVSGHDVPLPIGSFEDLVSRFQINKRLLHNLLDAEFVEPTPIQCEGIPAALNDRDLIGCAPTGSGKTLAFLIPMIQTLLQTAPQKNKKIRGLIIAPTNELASQIFQQLQVLTKGYKNLPSAILSRQMATRLQDGIVSSTKYAIIVSTPLRLLDIVKNGHADLTTVEQLVIDEADRLFDKGFVEQTDALLANMTNPKLRKSIFSATIPSGVEELANSIMRDPVRIIVGHKEAASSNIDQKLVFTGSEDGKLVAIREMLQKGEFKPPVIIFLQSITRAKALFHELLYDKLNVDVIHAERTPKQRDEVIKRFKNGDIWVLITTDVLARGVDFRGVNLVINYDVPQTAQAYVHRIGRTGRGTNKGKAVTFFTKEDTQAVKPIVNVMKQSGCSDGYSDWMENMGKLSYFDKRKVKTQQIERAGISTVPKIVKQKRKQRQEMIEASKRRKQQSKKGGDDN